jgi:hypothetical protein
LPKESEKALEEGSPSRHESIGPFHAAHWEAEFKGESGEATHYTKGTTNPREWDKSIDMNCFTRNGTK